MRLILEHGSARAPYPIVDALESQGLAVDAVVQRDTWPERLELQAEGDLDFGRLRDVVAKAMAATCPDEILLAVRIVRDPRKPDLLYSVPCDQREPAVAALESDVRAVTDDSDAFRSWFRSRWMGRNEEDALTAEELATEPLTAKRILAYLDPHDFRDWRPIQHFIERHASCADLVSAMVLATTAAQKWRLAYAFNSRGRSCRDSVPELIRFLDDDDQRVREEAADSLGQVVIAVRGSDATRLKEAAGEALLGYVQAHPEDNLYFARTALGVTGYEAARPYLESIAVTGTGQAQESARRGLDNLNATSRQASASEAG